MKVKITENGQRFVIGAISFLLPVSRGDKNELLMKIAAACLYEVGWSLQTPGGTPVQPSVFLREELLDDGEMAED